MPPIIRSRTIASTEIFVKRLSELNKKIWNKNNFKDHVNPIKYNKDKSLKSEAYDEFLVKH